MEGKRLNRRKRDHIIAWLFLFPATFAFVVFMFWPLAYTVYSHQEVRGL